MGPGRPGGCMVCPLGLWWGIHLTFSVCWAPLLSLAPHHPPSLLGLAYSSWWANHCPCPDSPLLPVASCIQPPVHHAHVPLCLGAHAPLASRGPQSPVTAPMSTRPGWGSICRCAQGRCLPTACWLPEMLGTAYPTRHAPFLYSLCTRMLPCQPPGI